MKNIIKKAFLVTFVTIGLYSCSEDSKDPVAKEADDFTMSAPVDGTFVLTAATAGDEAVVVQWESADFGYQAATNYKLQMVKSTDSFSDDQTLNPSISLGNYSSVPGASFEKSLKSRDFNNLVLAANPSGIGNAVSYKIRIYALVNNQLASSDINLNAKSQEATVTVTAYDAFDEFDRLYVPGNFGGASGYADWTPSNAPKLFSKANDGKYEGFVWMNNPNPEFKFTPVPDWVGDKGDITEFPNSFTDLVQAGGKNIRPTDGAGTYFLTVNWNTDKYTIAKRQIAMIGQATPNGWGTPTYMTFVTDPASPYYRMFTLDLALTADEFLIRLKDDWSEKMGTLSGNTETLAATNANGIKIGGGNMKVPTAGNYKIVLDVRNAANYNLRLIPN
ncbi:SusE domain-containing protein [Flavobacterium sp. AS60]|uniref:SusE domain-containing protein n=1 Tax=Flavobacterium anseongense TaxID=2910677 RepID=UPI001F3D0DF5|nr:SusE domain-containing protein [Flavobacterium sp. AS60]MCF6129186.1 SusE domain-containing protein [Flavobacterium sp. AS60]